MKIWNFWGTLFFFGETMPIYGKNTFQKGLPLVEPSRQLPDDSTHLRPSEQRGNFSCNTESLCGRMIKGSKKGCKLKSKHEVAKKVT